MHKTFPLNKGCRMKQQRSDVGDIVAAEADPLNKGCRMKQQRSEYVEDTSDLHHGNAQQGLPHEAAAKCLASPMRRNAATAQQGLPHEAAAKRAWC